jgi:Ca-activated chloride channel family protein
MIFKVSLYRFPTSLLALTLLALIALASAAQADGILVPGRWAPAPHPPPHPWPEPAPAFAIAYHHVDVEITGQVAQTRIDQVFRSESPRELEATYLFPIPQGATIREFSLWVNGRKTPGRILAKEEARQLYERIVRERRDPALLEYADRGLFQVSVSPVPPHGEQRIEIEYTELLERNDDLLRYTYPLDTERFSSLPIESVRISVAISAESAIRNVYSPTHKVSVRRPAESRAMVSYEETGTRPDRDFTVFYSFGDEDVGLSLLTYRNPNPPPGDEDGFFLLLAAPRAQVQSEQILAKDVVFVFDRTGSMQGEKIVQARQALEFCLRGLNPRDRFNLITFNESPDPLFPSLVPADPERLEEALALAERLTAEGGTNIDAALTTALPLLDDPERPSFVLFLTDGLPTVAERSPARILEHVSEFAPAYVHVFAFGVGYDVNTFLLDQLAQAHDGEPEYVRPGEDLEVKVSNIYRKISYPMLADLELAWEGFTPRDIFPQDLPDLFKGSQLVLVGRYRGQDRPAVTLTGQARGRKHRFTWRGSSAADDRAHDFIPLLWAGRKIAYLTTELRLGGHQQELVDEIVRLSKQYGIINEYTSFLVDEPQIVFAPDFERRAATTYGALNTRKLSETSGGSAVNQSVNVKDGMALAQAPANRQKYYDAGGKLVTIDKVRNVAGRTFFRQDGAWIENAYSEGMDVLEVVSYSHAQFQLLERDPSLGEAMAVGDEVLLLVNGRAVRIGKNGLEELDVEQLRELFGEEG